MMRIKQPCEDLRKDLSSQKQWARKARQRPQVRNELGKFEEQKENQYVWDIVREE